ncbi:tyrosine-type recombinase/integrase [Roseovarius sp. MMSF_3281]|uniref:tyrosine-type recombinase/integrase n=1 Tax=Roseovarius sp. MMSF_3281 TaxID=3046694 RepID=UPI00273DDF3B|nr:tyrosine-type recombinase/integrase [Roseovarius sp. MMSF_3281]
MTERRKLTDAFAKKHFEARNPRIIWDETRSGFGLKVYSKGNVEWIVKYRVGTGRSARRRQYKIGPPSLYSCVEARALADDFIVAGRRGEDYCETLKTYSSQQQTDVDEQTQSLLLTAWKNALLLNTDVTERHARSRERMWKHISERHGDFLRTKDLDTPKIARIRDEMSDRPAEFNKFRMVLNTVLENEVYEGRLHKNPVKRIKPYPSRFRTTILTEKGVSDFVKYFSDLSNFSSNHYNHARYVLCLLKTGVRPAMLRTLLAEDDESGNFIDWTRGVVVFRNHKTDKKSTAKTAEIQVDPKGGVLRTMRAAHEDTPHSKYVFGSHDKRQYFQDLHISEKGTLKFFRYHVNKEGFETEGTEELVLYSLRHTFGSTLVNSGISITQVSKIMLHKNITTTQRYIKDTAEMRLAVAQRIDEIIK